MKRADQETPPGVDPEDPAHPEPEQQTGKHRGDARSDGKEFDGKQVGEEQVGEEQAGENQARLEENQEQLGVDPDHKTDAMKQGHRGTFS